MRAPHKLTNDRPVIGIGEILWDLLPDGPRLGGAPANFAFHVHSLGYRGIIVSRVGQDREGDRVMECVRSQGMETDFISRDSRHPTGSVSVALDDTGDPRYTIHTDVAWDYLEMNEAVLDLARRTRAVCFGSLGQRSPRAKKTILRFLSEVPEDGLRVFDINMRQSFFDRKILHRSLEESDVLKLNQDELEVLAGLLDLKGGQHALIRSLLDRYGLSLIALTRGGNGSILTDASEISDHPGIRVDVKDTVGAGDAFTAGLVVGVLQGDSLDAINEKANRIASSVCRFEGAWTQDRAGNLSLAQTPGLESSSGKT